MSQASAPDQNRKSLTMFCEGFGLEGRKQEDDDKAHRRTSRGDESLCPNRGSVFH